MAHTVYFITPMYNTEDFLDDTIQSVIRQSYGNFKLVLCDDCSTDNTKAIAQQAAQRDNRIVILSHSKNEGAYKAGNTALDYALKHASEDDYIYILDSDDLLIEGGVQKQVDFMQNHPKIDVLGGELQCFGTSDKTLNSFETDNDLIHMGLLFNSTTAHAGTLIRPTVLARIRYEPTHYYAHDYHFFTRIAFDTGAIFTSLKQPVYLYRMHANQTSTKDHSKQRDSADGVRRDILARLGITRDHHEAIIQTHLHLCHKQPYHISEIQSWVDYITVMVDANDNVKLFAPVRFTPWIVEKTIQNICRMGYKGIAIYHALPKSIRKTVSMKHKLKIYVSALRPYKK